MKSNGALLRRMGVYNHSQVRTWCLTRLQLRFFQCVSKYKDLLEYLFHLLLSIELIIGKLKPRTKTPFWGYLECVLSNKTIFIKKYLLFIFEKYFQNFDFKNFGSKIFSIPNQLNFPTKNVRDFFSQKVGNPTSGLTEIRLIRLE